MVVYVLNGTSSLEVAPVRFFCAGLCRNQPPSSIRELRRHILQHSSSGTIESVLYIHHWCFSLYAHFETRDDVMVHIHPRSMKTAVVHGVS